HRTADPNLVAVVDDRLELRHRARHLDGRGVVEDEPCRAVLRVLRHEYDGTPEVRVEQRGRGDEDVSAQGIHSSILPGTMQTSFAGIVLTFQAGAEVDVPQLVREWKASVSIGLVSFFAPFAVVALVTYYALDWSRRQAEIGGLALSTTSLAVVYAVLVETGLNRELVGKRLMSATFVTDIATVTGLTVLFGKPTVWIVPFALVSVAMIFGLPHASHLFF